MIASYIRPATGTPHATFAAALLARFLEMMELARQRRHLAALSDWQLKDIGLSRADVAAETGKSFWRV